MEPTPELLDEIEHERIERARKMHPVRRLLAGADLFDFASAATLAGIQQQHPEWSKAEAVAMLRERLDWRARSEMEERGA